MSTRLFSAAARATAAAMSDLASADSLYTGGLPGLAGCLGADAAGAAGGWAAMGCVTVRMPARTARRQRVVIGAPIWSGTMQETGRVRRRPTGYGTSGGQPSGR